MRGLNNEQLAVMREVGPGGAKWRRRATKREARVLGQLQMRGLIYPEWSEDGGAYVARMTKIGRLLYDALTSQRYVKRMGL